MSIPSRRFLPLVLCPVIALAAQGCSTAPDDGTGAAGSDSTESALRALDASEIVGELHFGQTSDPVAYTETPLYRAFKVDAAAGDTIDAWVRSTTGGDARAWILSSTFATLTWNNDADATTRDAHVTKKIMHAGTYYVAFRDDNREDNTFTVALAPSTSSGGGGGGSGGGSGGSGAVDPFDDTLLHGTPLSSTDAKALFAAGASSATLGGFAVAERSRTCNATTGCTAWTRNSAVTFAYSTWQWWNPGPGWSNQKACFQFKSETFTSVTGSMSLGVGATGQFALTLVSNPTGTVSCANVTGSGAASCGSLSSSGISQPSGGSDCSLPNPAGAGFDPTVYPSTVPLFDTSSTQASALGLSVLVTKDYVYGRTSAAAKADATGTHVEVEYALYGLMKSGATPDISGGGSACKPKTCAGLGKTCGTISDGCGGTISCGTCDYPYQCGTDNTCQVPPGCNLQPCYAGATVGYTCCGSNQVTCSNGTGCTCYDACF